MELTFRFSGNSLASLVRKVNVHVSAESFDWKWLKLIKLSPRVECFWWRLLNNAIPTCDFLMYRRILQANNCPRGCIVAESIEHVALIESGEKEKLMDLLRERLIECGWRDEMKTLCRSYARKKGRNNVTVDDLIHVITPKGRASVPDSVKAELLQRIRAFLTSAAL
ncbi:hypothetical protein KFK09_000296 [Dendrobium nobile]|uniref:Transcription and mRNA export factor ENY2 n=1 Tax=Dendrobium nobile TaxID=94219 RepID=A0A8T3C895_DENNO|nr:hypothetical protein KFK09_000296 [Dendrobium nobile]